MTNTRYGLNQGGTISSVKRTAPTHQYKAHSSRQHHHHCHPSEDGRHHHRHHLIGTPQCHFGVKVLKEAENGFIVGPEPASMQFSCSTCTVLLQFYSCSSTPSVHYFCSSTPSVHYFCMQFYSRKSPTAWCEYNGT